MTTINPSLIERVRQRSREQLLHMRAEGDDLPDEWHDAIEAVFAERGETAPPRPFRPINATVAREAQKGDALLVSGGLLVAMVVGGMLKRSWRRQPAQPRFHSDRACRS